MSNGNVFYRAIRNMERMGHNNMTIPRTAFFYNCSKLWDLGFSRFGALEWLSEDGACLARRRSFFEMEKGLACNEMLGDAADVARAVMSDVYNQYDSPDGSHDVVSVGTVRGFANHFARTERAKSVVRLAFDVSVAADRVLIGELNEIDRLAVQMIWRFCDPYMRVLPFRLDWNRIDSQYSLFCNVFCHEDWRLPAANYYRAAELLKMTMSPQSYRLMGLSPNHSGFKIVDHMVSVLNSLDEMFKVPVGECVQSQRDIALSRGCDKVEKFVLDADKKLEWLIFGQLSDREQANGLKLFVQNVYTPWLMAKEAKSLNLKSEYGVGLASMRSWLGKQNNIAIAMAIMDGALGLYQGPKTLMKVIGWLAEGYSEDDRLQIGVARPSVWPVEFLISKGKLLLMKEIWRIE